MVSEERIRTVFTELAEIDSESFGEKQIGENIVNRLRALGLEVTTSGGTRKEFLEAHPGSHPNIYAALKGTVPGEPVLFSAHLDTVAPGIGKRAVTEKDGTIRPAGNTVLGADDISGLTAILEALTVIQETGADHPDIEILITPAEEPFCEGSANFDFSLIRSGQAYVLDLTGPIGTAAAAAPTILSFEIEVRGKAAHAGFAPEKGINALTLAARTLAEIPTGHVGPDTTVNFGTIAGGTANNIVPESVRLTGEVRSLRHEEADRRVEEIFGRFNVNTRKAGGIAFCRRKEHIRAYRVDRESPAVRRFERACRLEGLEPRLTNTLGGSDANRLNEAGIPAIVTACGMENVHSTAEYTRVEDLRKSAELTLRLMTITEDDSNEK